MRVKTCLVTGGAGFIGSHLCQKLIGEGFRVVCLDNLITGRKENVARLANNPDFEFIEHDVTKYIDLAREKIDYIYHFASPASPIDYQKYPIQTLKVGSLGTHNTLGLAKAKGAAFLLASTSEIYGDPLVQPQREDYWGNVNPIGPRGVYDEAKRFAEALTLAYHRTHKIDTKIVRIFNTYGPRMREKDGRAVPNFINQALNNEPLTVFGDGGQTRSFCFITDLIDGIFKLTFSKVNEPVNLGNPNQLSILELGRKIIKLIGSKSKIVFEPLPVDDPKVRQPDIEKAKTELSWQPEVGLEDGLGKTIEWFRQ
jgi:dTDP-glucose 4,6-dehydratase